MVSLVTRLGLLWRLQVLYHHGASLPWKLGRALDAPSEALRTLPAAGCGGLSPDEIDGLRRLNPVARRIRSTAFLTLPFHRPPSGSARVACAFRTVAVLWARTRGLRCLEKQDAHDAFEVEAGIGRHEEARACCNWNRSREHLGWKVQGSKLWRPSIPTGDWCVVHGPQSEGDGTVGRKVAVSCGQHELVLPDDEKTTTADAWRRLRAHLRQAQFLIAGTGMAACRSEGRCARQTEVSTVNRCIGVSCEKIWAVTKHSFFTRDWRNASPGPISMGSQSLETVTVTCRDQMRTPG